MAIIRAKLTAAERRAGIDLRDVLGTRKTRKPRAAARKASKLGPRERHAGSELERLVDDYLDKHNATVRIARGWDREVRKANAIRDAAFRALAKARGRR